MGLEDIDEDEPKPIVIGNNARTGGTSNSNNATAQSSNSTNGTNNKDMMEDLFGPSTSSSSTAQKTTSSTNKNNSNNQSNSSSTSPQKKDALDDFFGAKPNKNSNNNSYSNSAANRNNMSNNNNNNSKPVDDVFDTLFTGGGNSNSTSSSSSNPNWHGGGGATTSSTNHHNSNNNTTKTTTTATRSAIDHLDAFSAVSKGAAVPWKQNTQSVSESHTKVLDIFGDGGGSGSNGLDDNGSMHNDRGIFIPPDQVLSLMTLYDVLGAAPNWPIEEISKAYKKKAIQLHPDKLPGGKRSEREDKYFKVLTAAYDVLKDKDKRAEYDSALKGGHAESGSWLNFVS